MSIHTLLNPFTRIAGFSALCYGCLLMFLTAAIAAPCGVNFASSLNIHVARPMPFMPIFSLLILGWLCAATVFYFAGLLFSPSKIRAVDIYGTFALARAPFLIAAPFGLLPGLWNLDPLQTQMPPTFWIFVAIALLVDIWIVILSYNAFAVSANMKNKWLFTAVFIISEVVAIVLSGPLVTWMLPRPMRDNPATPAAVVVGQANDPNCRNPEYWIWNRDHIVRNNIFAYNESAQVHGWFDARDARHCRVLVFVPLFAVVQTIFSHSATTTEWAFKGYKSHHALLYSLGKKLLNGA